MPRRDRRSHAKDHQVRLVLLDQAGKQIDGRRGEDLTEGGVFMDVTFFAPYWPSVATDFEALGERDGGRVSE